MKNLGWKSNFAILWPKVPRWWILNSTMVSLNNFQKMRNYLLIFDGSCEEIFNSKAFLKVATAVPHCGLNWFHNSIVQSITWFVPKNGWTFTVLYKQWFRTNKILSSKTFTNNCNCFFAQLVVILSTIASFIARNLLSKTWETSARKNWTNQWKTWITCLALQPHLCFGMKIKNVIGLLAVTNGDTPLGRTKKCVWIMD